MIILKHVVDKYLVVNINTEMYILLFNEYLKKMYVPTYIVYNIVIITNLL